MVLADLAHEGDDQLETIGGHFFVFRIALGTVGYLLALLIVVVGPYTHQEIEGVAIGGLSFFVASGLWSVISVCQARLWLRAVGVAIAVGAAVQLAVIVVLFATHTGTFLNFIFAYVLSDAIALDRDPDRDPQLVPRTPACGPEPLAAMDHARCTACGGHCPRNALLPRRLADADPAPLGRTEP